MTLMYDTCEAQFSSRSLINMLDDKTAFDTREVTVTRRQFPSLTICPKLVQFVQPKDFHEAEQAEIPLEQLLMDISHQTQERFLCIIVKRDKWIHNKYYFHRMIGRKDIQNKTLFSKSLIVSHYAKTYLCVTYNPPTETLIDSLSKERVGIL
jgi:hypothetical protein